MVTGSEVAASIGSKLAGGLLRKLFTLVSGNIRSVRLQLFNRNQRARVVAAAFVRIRRDSDGRYAIIRNRHRPEQYSAIGGCYKYHANAVSALEKLQFTDEYNINDDDTARDIRGYTKRKFANGIVKWFSQHPTQRESHAACLIRELNEELVEEAGLSFANDALDRLTFQQVRTYISYENSELDEMPLTQIKIFEVYDVEPSAHLQSVIDTLSHADGESILWVSKRDIMAGRCSRSNKVVGAVCELFVADRIKGQTFAPPLHVARRATASRP
ncbi:MAG: hypothetical protein JSS36_00180 [Proteobacteria bacterium]|nr:hypothetical protein [Pseudomonadota bacterium]